MSDRPTPLTDAIAIKAITPNEADSAMGLNPYLDAAATMAEHSRRLERQRDAAVEALKAYGQAGVGNSTDFRLQIKAWAMSNSVLREIEGES